MTRTASRALRLAAVLALAAAPIVDAAPRAEDPAPEEIERLEEWPEPRDAHQLKIDVARLRKARTEEMGEQAHAGLVAEGAACAPALLSALGKESDEDALERIEAVLAIVTGAPHTRLLAKEFDDEKAHVRTWCLMRVAGFPDPGVRAAARKAYGRAKEDEDASADERYAAALCCASAGDPIGLDRIAARAAEEWKQRGAEIRTALEAVRGREATADVAPMLDSEDRAKQVTGLRLLAGVGDRETAVPLVVPYLDSTDNTLRVAAINALRGIVDGDPPLDKLPVFEAIERANDWKNRI